MICPIVKCELSVRHFQEDKKDPKEEDSLPLFSALGLAADNALEDALLGVEGSILELLNSALSRGAKGLEGDGTTGDLQRQHVDNTMNIDSNMLVT